MIEYRMADKNDLSQIMELYKQLLPDEEQISKNEAEKIWDQMDHNNIKYFVAAENNRIVSACYLAIIPNLTRGGRSNGFIENVITHEDYRKKGIGKNVINQAIEYGKRHGCYKIVLLSSYTRKESHAFYESCGFDGNTKRGFEIRF